MHPACLKPTEKVYVVFIYNQMKDLVSKEIAVPCRLSVGRWKGGKFNSKQVDMIPISTIKIDNEADVPSVSPSSEKIN